eukprot:scaffold3620_cov143-Pinguiococcus_pyrenoidosus.AAC.1
MESLALREGFDRRLIAALRTPTSSAGQQHQSEILRTLARRQRQPRPPGMGTCGGMGESHKPLLSRLTKCTMKCAQHVRGQRR